jgi:hypothetical protein
MTEEKRVIPGIPPKKKRPKSKWMNGFKPAPAMTDMDYVESHRSRMRLDLIFLGKRTKDRGEKI